MYATWKVLFKKTFAKLRKNERRAKYCFAFPSGSNFGAAKVVLTREEQNIVLLFRVGVTSAQPKLRKKLVTKDGFWRINAE